MVKFEKIEARVVDLRAELSTRVAELNLAERTRMAAMAEAATLEGTLSVCRSERANEVDTSTLKVARLEERVESLEVELYGLNEQVVTLKVKKEQQQAQPSTFHTSADPSISRELYEMWVHAEAQLDVYKSLKAVGKVFEVELEGVCVMACAAREACGYDPGIPGGDDDDDAMDGLASDPWYDDEYADGDYVA